MDPLPSPPETPNAQRAQSLTARLREIGYHRESIVERLGIGDHRQNLTPRLADRLGWIAGERAGRTATDAVEVLLHLLLLNLPVPTRVVERTLDTETLDSLEALGLMFREGSEWRAELSLSEWDGLYFASDTMWNRRSPTGEFGTGPIPADAVLHPLFDSFRFAESITRRPARRALDLCTGSGVIALAASRTHTEVIGTDIMERSVVFARFNAALNRIQNVHFVRGDLYADTSGPFDTIAANPPYMPGQSAAPGPDFSSGGELGDRLTLAILRGLDDALEVGGYAHFTGFFLHGVGERGEPTVAPDLRSLLDRGYDLWLCVDEVRFRETGFVSSTARFGGALRVEYGTYTLRRHVLGDRPSWNLRNGSESTRRMDADALFSAVDRCADTECQLAELGLQ